MKMSNSVIFMLTNAVCGICGEDDPRVLKEWHHVFGRVNGSEIIRLCHNCHDKITKDQNSLPPKVRSKNSNEDDKLRFILVSIGSLLELIGKYLKKLGLEMHGNGS